MNVPTENNKQMPEATPLALLQSKTITVLTDSYMHAFAALHGEEINRRKLAKVRLAAELHGLDLFGLTVNRTDFEEYQPE